MASSVSSLTKSVNVPTMVVSVVVAVLVIKFFKI